MGKNNNYISFETAKLAKEKGCELDSQFYYNEKGESKNYDYDTDEEFCYKLTFSELDNWLSEIHNIHIEILIDKTMEPKYCFSIYKYIDEKIEWINLLNDLYSDLYLNKSECYDEALKSALNFIK